MKKTAFYLFLATCLLQWFVPVNMILQQENIIQEGTAFKFKTRPVDPNDPFRGKYVVLNYEADIYETNNPPAWERGEIVFVKIKADVQGFAQIESLEKEEPIAEKNYIKAEIQRIWGEKPTRISIKYPFERFYMEESKAPKAETMFRNLRNDTTTIAYSLVIINKGKAALEDVLVNGVSLKELTGEDIQ